jgi:hypothetical protein
VVILNKAATLNKVDTEARLNRATTHPNNHNKHMAVSKATTDSLSRSQCTFNSLRKKAAQEQEQDAVPAWRVPVCVAARKRCVWTACSERLCDNSCGGLAVARRHFNM